MNSYSYLAKVYDELMCDVNYEKWASYLHTILSEADATKLLEVSCGTGNVTFPLSRFGYDIIASDISIEMLSIAKQKNQELCADIRFVHQDMTRIEAARKFDAVVSACDGANYIDKAGLNMFLKSAYDALKAGGVLLFDISSKHKLKDNLDDGTYFDEAEDTVAIWKNTYDKEKSALSMDVTLFIKQGELYERMSETHTQHAHTQSDIIEASMKAGFSEVTVYDCFSFDAVRPDSERLQFVCRRI